MAIPLPNLSTPALLGKQPSFAPVWALFFQELRNKVGTDLATASATAPGTVFQAGFVADPFSPAVSVAPPAYTEAWGNSVVALLNEIKANQISFLEELRTAKVMADG